MRICWASLIIIGSYSTIQNIQYKLYYIVFILAFPLQVVRQNCVTLEMGPKVDCVFFFPLSLFSAHRTEKCKIRVFSK